MPTMKAVIFDLDGTLLNTIEDISDSCNYSLNQNGLRSFSVEEYKYFVGNGVDELIRNVLIAQNADLVLAQSVKKTYMEHYFHNQRNKTKPYPGITSLLLNLQNEGFLVNVLSNKPDPDTQNVIVHFFPEIHFAQIYGKKPGYPVKPDPRSVMEIISHLGVSPDEVLYVGDTFTDMMTARNAHLPAVGVLWGIPKEAELWEGGAWVVTDRPDQIVRFAKEGISRADSTR